MPNTFTQQRLAHLDSLAAELQRRGLVSRTLGGTTPVLWVWHPDSGRQTIVFATPVKDGWLFLWSPDGEESTDDPVHAADSVERLLAPPVEPS
ncbi:hypothetical protein OG884_26275 [Streptosporangium sp. NBC_01755]|uniref:hypothetical protein n=1 Tax=unclassified Streptosporangium TaxID=2632669 RepID=UPI002DDC82B7|nr:MULTISPECIES: hypothetical protein [unclassified Streptosporangium]WSA23439.1 hypothetical protein OIE13_21005 [Streptosporangium sp. NBC_01810]WSC98358.1 hypothetical protein OG884_26275 [Streptosporangium sp. NBC_01755]